MLKWCHYLQVTTTSVEEVHNTFYSKSAHVVLLTCLQNFPSDANTIIAIRYWYGNNNTTISILIRYYQRNTFYLKLDPH